MKKLTIILLTIVSAMFIKNENSVSKVKLYLIRTYSSPELNAQAA